MTQNPEWIRIAGEVEQVAFRAQKETAPPKGDPSGSCYWCDSLLFDSPTNRFWIRGFPGSRKGLCYDCIISSFRTVIAGLAGEATTPRGEADEPEEDET